MLKLIGRLCGVALLCALLGSMASAGPLPTDPNAMPLWQGSAAFSGTDFQLDDTLEAIVEYAVYAPGDYGTSAALDTPPDPSGGTDYIYTYEIFHLVAGNASVANLSIDLLHGAIPNSSTWIGHDPALPEGGVIPISSNLINGGSGYKLNAKWNFIPNMGGGQHSRVLFFASEFGPTWRVSSMQGSLGTTASQSLPSPTPEPGTFALAMFGAMCLLVIRCLRRQPR